MAVDTNISVTVPTGSLAQLGGGNLTKVVNKPLTEGNSYTIKIVTESGTEATYKFTYKK